MTKTSCCKVNHPDHSKQISRINRVIGQLEGIKRMIEERRYCPDILTQTSAARSAISSLEANILQKHLESCVQDAIASSSDEESNEKIQELIDIFKRLK